jgi:hypothetical protein
MGFNHSLHPSPLQARDLTEKSGKPRFIQNFGLARGACALRASHASLERDDFIISRQGFDALSVL